MQLVHAKRISDRQAAADSQKETHHYWGILTLDDLDKTNWKHSRLIIQFQTQ